MKTILCLSFCLTALLSCAQQKKTVPEAGKNFIPGDSLWTGKVVKSDAEWKKILSPEEYEITRASGTERPCSSELYFNKEEGIYYCLCCGNPLFSSKNKFNSGTGWPSYWRPYSSRSVENKTDNSLYPPRTEITCMRCSAHLGHVFEDGPPPTGLRYCVDGKALRFIKENVKK